MSPEGVMLDAERVPTIRNIPPRKNLKELQSFIGVCNYQRRFIPNATTLMDPFRDLLSGKNKYNWIENR